MALDALHAGMRRILVGGELGTHYVVTRLSAEGHRIHVVDRGVTELAGNYQVQDGRRADEVNQPPKLAVCPTEGRRWPGVFAAAHFFPALEPDAERDQE